MVFKQSFIDLIHSLESQDRVNFIGYGNPNSKVLIIGKECTYVDKYHIKYGIKENLKQWLSLVNDPHTITNFGEIPPIVNLPKPVDWSGKFCPLHPFKQQTNKVRKIKKSTIELYGKEAYNHNEPSAWINPEGSSVTWCTYQKLIDALFEREPSRYIDFFKDCFITDLSEECKPMSGAYSQKTQESINRRLKNKDSILKHPFFQEFPIIILACHRYVDLPKIGYDINICQSFDQKVINQITNQKGFAKGEFIWLHKNGKRLLLHTNQLSERSNALIECIAHICQEHLTSL